jgi:hypothetical protein
MWGEDRSRGLRAPAAAAQRHRVLALRAEPLRVSSLRASPDWRGVLQMWAGPALTIGVLLFFIFGIGRHLHG